MLNKLVVAFLLLSTSVSLSQESKSSAPTQTKAQASSSAKDQNDEDLDPAALLKVKRIYIDSFGDDAISRDLQSTVVSSLVATKRFRVTENRERADAILKGVALEKTSQEVHSYGEGTEVRGAAISDSSSHTETLNQAKLSIRLVNPDGDVIWTTTQESKGGKYKGASADVADMCIKQLLRDVAKLEGSAPSQAATGTESKTAQRQ